MKKKNLLDFDLQLFAEEGEVADAEVSEAVEPTEEPEAEGEETVADESGNDEPPEQSAEENARYAAIRRKAEQDAQRKLDGILAPLNQQVAAMCNGVTHPVTGRPVTNVQEYFDALAIQERMQREEELKEKGIDPQMIDKAVASNPLILRAQQIVEQQQQNAAEMALQNDIAELQRLDSNIKSINDVPNLDAVVGYVAANNVSIVDAYKVINYDILTKNTQAAGRQQAINEMRGKDHLASQGTTVATENDDDIEVPSEIMSRMKAEGKSEKQIKGLLKSAIRNGLSI